ncbi:Imm30 family immunity protein [Sphingobium scionense]|uniref:Immunity protein 30 domain-containing protein n=1 Tax=Sphingobium scionense TaxID=1404341 RepID=A0A7W6LP69_9SPHN|nr:Imm30 family immunity protein [Sphingobium scionense]MBB4146756.1 hypothetical protein [Sphingobium scionense]
MIEDRLNHLRRVIADGQTALAVDAALDPIASAANPETIKPLLLMLNDDSDDDGMWSIVHAAEQFDDHVYISSFVAALPFLNIASARWASIVMMRVLNSDAAKSELVRQLRSAPEDARKVATIICERINTADPRFLAKTTAILIAAK